MSPGEQESKSRYRKNLEITFIEVMKMHSVKVVLKLPRVPQPRTTGLDLSLGQTQTGAPTQCPGSKENSWKVLEMTAFFLTATPTIKSLSKRQSIPLRQNEELALIVLVIMTPN